MSDEPRRPLLKKTFGDFEVKMTYGLQLDLQRIVQDPSELVALLVSDPFVRDYIVRRTLTDTPKSITDEEKLIPHDEITLDPDEVIALLDWVSEHLLYFFGKSASSAARLGQEYQNQLARLIPSMTGSSASASTTPSAGPSDASKETSTTSTGDTASGSFDKGSGSSMES